MTYAPHPKRRGYFIVPFTDGCGVSSDGSVIGPDGQELPHKLDQYSRPSVKFKRDGQQLFWPVAKMLALVFIGIPDGYGKRTHSVVHADRDLENLNIDNLSWVLKADLAGSTLLSKREEFKKSAAWPIWDGVTGYAPNPIPYPQLPGYYCVPDTDSPHVVNRRGSVLNAMTLQPISESLEGYCHLSLSIQGKSKTIGVHRLLGKMFLTIPKHLAHYNPDDLEINHKDGVKNNNDISNLEWCTASQNLLHAVRTGLRSSLKTGRSDRIKTRGFPILAKDVRTGEVTKFATVAAVCKVHNVRDQTLTVRLNSGLASTRTRGWHVFKYDDGSDWLELKDHHLVEDRWDITGTVWFASKLGEKVAYARTPEQLEDFFGWKRGIIKYKVYRRGLENPVVNGWQVCTDDDPSYSIAQATGLVGFRKIREASNLAVTNRTTGQELGTFSINEAAKIVGISFTALARNIAQIAVSQSYEIDEWSVKKVT